MDEEGLFAGQAMREGSMCSMKLSGSYRGELIRTLFNSIVHVLTDVGFSS